MPEYENTLQENEFETFRKKSQRDDIEMISSEFNKKVIMNSNQERAQSMSMKLKTIQQLPIS